MVSRFPVAVLAAFTIFAAPAYATPKVHTVYSFGERPDSQNPYDGLIADKAGNLYGTANEGGNGLGTVFMIGMDGTEKIIYSFRGTDGESPRAALAMDKAGDLFGTTKLGGANFEGAIFELSPNGGTYTGKMLYSFCSLANCADGAFPTNALLIGPKGVLYGVTQTGGAGAAGQNDGVLFRLDPPKNGQTAWTEKVIHTFCDSAGCADGMNPVGTPVIANDGYLYGTTWHGGQGDGVLYRVKPNDSGFQVLHNFVYDGQDGFEPLASLTLDDSGALYGTTNIGGTKGNGDFGGGTVFSFDPTNSMYSKVYDFDYFAVGSGPSSAVTIVKTKQGTTFYGITQIGPNTGTYGALYSLTPPSNSGDPWVGETLNIFCQKEACIDGGLLEEDRLLNVKGTIYGTTEAGGTDGAGIVFKYGKK